MHMRQHVWAKSLQAIRNFAPIFPTLHARREGIPGRRIS
jgi:hypothetical protein